MTIALPLEPIQTNKITKKPIDLMLPPCRYQEFLHQQLSHRNKDTRRQVQPSTEDFEIPELEENSEEEQFTDFDSFMTHHNTHQASEHIWQEYFSHLQDLDNDQYYAEINRANFPRYTLATQYHHPANHKEAPRRSTEELKRIFGRGRGQAR